MPSLLDGVRVLDMGQVVAVPTACGLLADWGAEVIKVEPLAGDTLRGARVSLGMTEDQRKVEDNTVNWGMQLFNKNKKSIALDLKQNAGKEVIYRLVKKFDVFVTNYELNSIKKLGMDYATLSRHSRGIIYGILSAYGLGDPTRMSAAMTMAQPGPVQESST